MQTSEAALSLTLWLYEASRTLLTLWLSFLVILFIYFLNLIQLDWDEKALLCCINLLLCFLFGGIFIASEGLSQIGNSQCLLIINYT
jgi:hypothetical protein